MPSIAFLPTPLRGFLRRSFLERNQKLIGTVAVVLIVGGSAFALLLQGGVFASTYGVTAFFTDAAGINPGDEVTVAGLKAGTVKGLEVEHGRVAMDLAINSGVELPRDSRATVKVQTLLGRETVDLVAGQSKQKLADGDVIPLARTTTPIDITELNDISVHLLRQSDAHAFNQLLDEVAQITAGKEAQVQTLIKGLADVTQAIDERRAQLGSLITAFKVVSTTLADKDKAILSLIDHLNPVLTNLAARQQAIRTLLEATDSASHATADLVARNRTVLDATLRGLHTDLQILDRHQVDLAATIAYLNGSVHGYQSVGYSESRTQPNGRGGSGGVNNRWANIFVQSLGPLGGDALLGKCGVIDQLVDQVLGSNCHKTPKNPPPVPVPTPRLPIRGPLPRDPLPIPLPLPTPTGIHVPTPTISPPGLPKPRLNPPPLPENVGVIVKTALTGGGTGS